GEAVGARRSAFDRQAGTLRINRPLLQLGGRVVESTPKTRAGQRVLLLDEETAALVARDVAERAREKLALGEAYEDHDLIWCREDGRPSAPETVSRRFKELAARAGLQPIKLHEGRHTAATLRLIAE